MVDLRAMRRRRGSFARIVAFRARRASICARRHWREMIAKTRPSMANGPGEPGRDGTNRRLLLDEFRVGPQPFGIAVAGVHEFDVPADDAHDTEVRMLGRRQALVAGEIFLHLLLFA